MNDKKCKVYLELRNKIKIKFVDNNEKILLEEIIDYSKIIETNFLDINLLIKNILNFTLNFGFTVEKIYFKIKSDFYNFLIDNKIKKVKLLYFKNIEYYFEDCIDKFKEKNNIQLFIPGKRFKTFRFIVLVNNVFDLKNFSNLLYGKNFDDLIISIGGDLEKEDNNINLNNIEINQSITLSGIKNLDGVIKTKNLKGIILTDFKNINPYFFKSLKKLEELFLITKYNNNFIVNELNNIKITKFLKIDINNKKIDNRGNLKLKDIDNIIISNFNFDGKLEIYNSNGVTINKSKIKKIEINSIKQTSTFDSNKFQSLKINNVSNTYIFNCNIKHVWLNNIKKECEILQTIFLNLIIKNSNKLKFKSFAFTIINNKILIKNINNIEFTFNSFNYEIVKNIFIKKINNSIVFNIFNNYNYEIIENINLKTNKKLNYQNYIIENILLFIDLFNKNKYLMDNYKKTLVRIENDTGIDNNYSIIYKTIKYIENNEINKIINDKTFFNKEELNYLITNQIKIPDFIINNFPSINKKIKKLLFEI